MTDRDRPLSSEEMIKQARESLGRVPTTPDEELDIEDITERVEDDTSMAADSSLPPSRAGTRRRTVRTVRREEPRHQGQPAGFGQPTPKPQAAVAAAIAVAVLLLGAAVFLALAFGTGTG